MFKRIASVIAVIGMSFGVAAGAVAQEFTPHHINNVIENGCTGPSGEYARYRVYWGYGNGVTSHKIWWYPQAGGAGVQIYSSISTASSGLDYVTVSRTNGDGYLKIQSLGAQGQSVYTSNYQVTDNCGASSSNAPTVAPANFTVNWHACYGQNSGNWSAVTGATSYQVRYGSATGDNGIITTVPSLGAGFNVGSTTTVKVRACNDDGCGPDSTVATARYENYCL